MLENDDKDNDEGSPNDIEDVQKMIRPADIKQEAIHPELENLDDELDDSVMIDDDHDDDDDEDDDSEYDDGNEDSKNCGESSNPKKSKVTKNSVKKKAPEILIPQMVS